MKRTCVVSLALLVFAPAAWGAEATQECSIRTIVGTYAGGGAGNLWFGDGGFKTTPEGPPLMPAALLTRLTIRPDGTTEADLWSGLGVSWFPDMKVPGTVAVNPDCTGEYRYAPFGGEPNVETFVILEDGLEIRSAYAATPLAQPLAMTMAYHRVGGYPHRWAPRVPRTTRGSWVLTCTGFSMEPSGLPMSFSSSMLARFRVDRHGNLLGTAWHKVGPAALSHEITGNLTVEDDGFGDAELDMHPALPMKFIAKLLFFDEGRAGLMPMTVLMDTPAGPQPFAMPARQCTLERQ